MESNTDFMLEHEPSVEQSTLDGPPFFGIVIPTYNRAGSIARAIASVIDQSFSDLEVMVVDDGSSDNTGDVVKAFVDPRVHYLRRDNGGQCAARNTGASAARADYLVFLDDDDELLPSALDALRATILRDSAAVAWGAGELAYEDGTVQREHVGDLGPAFDHAVGLMLPGSFAIRRDVYLSVGGYAEELPCSTQSEFWLRTIPFCVQHSLRIAALDEPVVRVNQGRPEDRPVRSPGRLVESIDYILARHGERMARDRRYLADCEAISGVASARLGHHADARRRFALAIRANPRQWRHLARWLIACVPPLASRTWQGTRYEQPR